MNCNIKLEIKYCIVYSCQNQYMQFTTIMNTVCPLMSKLSAYINRVQPKISTIQQIDESKFLLYLLNVEHISNVLSKVYVGRLRGFKSLIGNFFDDREETQKDIWNCLNIHGVRKSATCSRRGYTINFLEYPQYYRSCIKKYFRTIITKKSLNQCLNIHSALVSFFENFKEIGYTEGFLKNLTREDIEKYVCHINGKYTEKNGTYVSRMLAYPKIFLEYIQLANYEEAPTKEISFLIFQDDIPKREKYYDTLKKVKFIPLPILQHLDGSIMELDRPELIPIYVLLRGTDILNLRYDSCIDKIWNGKE